MSFLQLSSDRAKREKTFDDSEEKLEQVRISYSRVAFCLCFKMSPETQPFIWK